MINILKYSFTLILLGAFTLAMAGDGKGKYERVIQDNQEINLDGKVRLSNKYGKIDIQTWDKPMVDVSVVITVVAKSQEKADATFDRIAINFSGDGNNYSAETDINSKSGAWWAWWNGNSSDEFSIDYTVRMPTGCRLSVNNKYGDVFLDELNNDLNLEIKYGNFDIGCLLYTSPSPRD